MPDDDITHPIPDLTGYITEGQLVLSRDLHRKGVYPPIDPLPSLSRLMNAGIGEGKTRPNHRQVSEQLYTAYSAGRTRPDHRQVADQLYSLYATGCDLRRLVAIVGEAALSEEDQRYLAFAERFEREFVHQGQTNRTLAETFAQAWQLLGMLPGRELKRIKAEFIELYYPELEDEAEKFERPKSLEPALNVSERSVPRLPKSAVS
jgi:V/A-type H+-transporting ATPase subunit B